ncbi:MAG: hypothetical protein ABH950_10275 [Candidatus Altiarchaeota archaeon]
MDLKRILLISSILSVLFVAGCLSGSSGPPPPVYINPCNIVDEGEKIKVSPTLSWENVLRPLSLIFLDDMVSPSASNTKKTLNGWCRYGQYTGEVLNNYYCGGSYTAPDLDEKGVITRYIKKQFKIDFELEKHEGETWIDLNGKQHYEAPYWILTVVEVEPTCTLVR